MWCCGTKQRTLNSGAHGTRTTADPGNSGTCIFNDGQRRLALIVRCDVHRAAVSKKLDARFYAVQLDDGFKLQLRCSVEILFYSLAVLVLVLRTPHTVALDPRIAFGFRRGVGEISKDADVPKDCSADRVTRHVRPRLAC